MSMVTIRIGSIVGDWTSIKTLNIFDKIWFIFDCFPIEKREKRKIKTWTLNRKNCAYKSLTIWFLMLAKRYGIFSFLFLKSDIHANGIESTISLHYIYRLRLHISQTIGSHWASMRKTYWENGWKIIRVTSKSPKNTWFEALMPMATQWLR